MMIVTQFIQGKAIVDISTSLEVNRTTVSKIIKRFKESGEIMSKKKGGDFTSKLSGRDKEAIISWVDEDPLLTLGQLKEKINEELGRVVSISTVDRCLKNFHYTLKSLVPCPVRRNCDNTIEQRYQYALQYRLLESEIGDRNIIFIDEVGFSVSTRPKRGRSVRGTSPFVIVPSARSRNISVIAAMTRNGMIFHSINNSAINGETYKMFICELIQKCAEFQIMNPVFVMDNARIHHYHGLNGLKSVENRGWIYLPPYSPFLNPIENVFSKWKNFVLRSRAENESQLKDFIVSGFREITSDDCESFYRKMLNYLIRAERKEFILE